MNKRDQSGKAIYLRAATVDAIIDPFGMLTPNAKANIIGLPGGTMWRLMTKDGHAGERAIIAIIEGMAACAKRVGREPPTFEELFEIRAITETEAPEPALSAA